MINSTDCTKVDESDSAPAVVVVIESNTANIACETLLSAGSICNCKLFVTESPITKIKYKKAYTAVIPNSGRQNVEISNQVFFNNEITLIILVGFILSGFFIADFFATLCLSSHLAQGRNSILDRWVSAKQIAKRFAIKRVSKKQMCSRCALFFHYRTLCLYFFKCAS